MKTTTVILKGKGWKYSGELISETENELILIDIKLGKIVINKLEVAVRGDF